MKLCSVAIFAAAVFGTDAVPSKKDLQRAKTKVPGAPFQGSSFAKASAKLNAALERSSAAPMLVACSELSVDELQATMTALVESRNADLGKIYASTNDARALRHRGLDGYEEEWALVASAAASPELAKAAHDGMCHEAVMLYVHHLTEAQRNALASRGGLLLPKLPVGARQFASGSHDTLEPEARAIVDAYLRSTGCAACHTDQDGLTPDTPAQQDAPQWPPAAEPVIPWRWSAELGGWMDQSGHRTEFTGSFHYDFVVNRMKEHWVVSAMQMEIINYWFGAPGPDWEGAKDLPEGAVRGHIYQVMKMGGRVLSCRDDTYQTFSIVRPDAFIKQWHNDAENLHYIARVNLSKEDMGGATGWADHWTYVDTCGNFSLWISLDNGLPVYTRGPTGCNSGDAGNSYLNHTLVAPADDLFQYNFSRCKPGNKTDLHKALWGSPADVLLPELVV